MNDNHKKFMPRRSIRIHTAVGALAVLVMVGGVGGWAATTDISGALIAAGSVVVESDVKKVQHPTGGVIGALNVRNGDAVHAGDVIVRLDETMLRANLGIVIATLDELIARAARLGSERDGLDEIAFPDNFLARSNEPNVARVINGEQRLFALRRTARVGQKQQLGQRIAQLNEEARGLTAQQEAKGKEIELIQRELEGVKELWDKKLIPLTRLTSLERESTRLEGERAQLVASVAQSRGKVAEIGLQIIQIDQDLASEVSKELREIDAKTSEYVERKVAAEDQLRRIDIRAPQDGIVHELNVHTIGGVVSPGEQIMLIVPAHDALTVEARVSPQDIDQVWIGQTAALRFTAFSARTTPQIEGQVSRVSADTTTEQRTGAIFYTVRIAIPASEIAKLGDVRLVPGMTVEAFIKTGERTVASYLVKPLSDQLMRAFRER
jgi:membrane fusion protein, type I secretion system